MNNAVLTPKVFARMVLFNLRSRQSVCRNMSTDVSAEFAKRGNKIGSTVQVRRPYRFEAKSGLVYQPQPIVDQAMTVTLTRVAQVSYDWDSVEKTLDIRDVDRLYAVPAAIALSSKINAEAATYIAQNTANSVGTPGTVPTTAASYLAAADLIIAQGLPQGEELSLIINRRMSSAWVEANKSLFNPQTTIGKQWQNGEFQPSLGYRLFMDQSLNQHTVGTFAGTPLVNGSNQTGNNGNNGTQTIITDGWSSGASTLNKGDKFTLGSASSATVGGVESVDPNTRQSTGYQQQFTVLETVSDTTGAMTISIYPAITPSGQYQNVNQAPVDNAIITVVGTTGAVAKQQGLVLHPDSFAFVSVPLDAPSPGEGALVANERDPETGVSLRIIKAFDYVNSVHINRIDVLYDFAPLYRELACVVQS